MSTLGDYIKKSVKFNLLNIYLNELVKVLEDREHKFSRYVYDLQIYVKSKRSGYQVMENVGKVLEKKLLLNIN